ncbi:MAG: DNA-binding protein Alba [Candidatus Bathyarchaeota archaeon]|nr:DNA-binding protein Alba [Candidatus Bathyarchaeota archaeon]MDH5787134.1 DNA-binding protein Alba [Candidatus Bathyarchaeota archaeon]
MQGRRDVKTTEKKEKPKEEHVDDKKTEEAPRTRQAKENIVFIGSKPPMSYVLAIITSLSASNAKEITLKARGRAISTAVDAAEITRRRFMNDLKVSEIALGTEEMPAREGETRGRMTSTMEIKLVRE